MLRNIEDTPGQSPDSVVIRGDITNTRHKVQAVIELALPPELSDLVSNSATYVPGVLAAIDSMKIHPCNACEPLNQCFRWLSFYLGQKDLELEEANITCGRNPDGGGSYLTQGTSDGITHKHEGKECRFADELKHRLSTGTHS